MVICRSCQKVVGINSCILYFWLVIRSFSASCTILGHFQSVNTARNTWGDQEINGAFQTGYIALRRALWSENNHGCHIGRSKPKCSKLATSKGPSELRISKSTTDGHFGPHDSLRRFFPWWRCLHVGTGWWHRRALQETVVWSPTSFNPSKLSPRRVNPEGIRA